MTSFFLGLTNNSLNHFDSLDKAINISQLPGSTGFSIFCTSNQDTTGACNRTDNNKSIPCLMVPGSVINCKEEGEKPIQCVLYSSTLDSQGYFYCTRRTDPGVINNRINPNRFTSPNQVNFSNPIPTNTFQNPLFDSLN
jgi:hypothetical protein